MKKIALFLSVLFFILLPAFIINAQQDFAEADFPDQVAILVNVSLGYGQSYGGFGAATEMVVMINPKIAFSVGLGLGKGIRFDTITVENYGKLYLNMSRHFGTSRKHFMYIQGGYGYVGSTYYLDTDSYSYSHSSDVYGPFALFGFEDQCKKINLFDNVAAGLAYIKGKLRFTMNVGIGKWWIF